MEEQLSNPVKIPQSTWRFLIPAISGFVVLGVFLLLLWDFPSSALNRSADPIIPKNNEALVLIRGPFAWLSSGLAVNILMIATLVIAVYILWQEVSRSIFFFVVSFVAVSAILLGIAFYDQQTFIELPLAPVLSIEEAMAKPPATRWMDCLAWCETLMLIAALCGLSSSFPRGSGNVRNLLFRRKRFTTWLLYLAAFTLTISVVQVNLLFKLPANAAALHLSVEQLGALSEGITMFIGTFFTLLLLALFSPVFLILNAEIQALAANTGNAASAADLEGWLKKNGLTDSWKQYLPHLAALLGPLLAGWLGEPVVRALAM